VDVRRTVKRESSHSPGERCVVISLFDQS
jgi:hypothetical protein